MTSLSASETQIAPTTSEEEDANDFCSLMPQDRIQKEYTFSIYDTVGDGKIDINDLGETLRACALNPSEDEIRSITKELDTPFKGRLSFEEFLPIYQSLERKKRTNCSSDFASALRIFDQDLSGKISTVELQHVLTSLGEGLSQEDANTLIAELVDRNGKVDIDDFVKSVMNG